MEVPDLKYIKITYSFLNLKQILFLSFHVILRKSSLSEKQKSSMKLLKRAKRAGRISG